MLCPKCDPQSADARLERDIQRAKDQFMAATTPDMRRRWLRTMEELISMRSEAQVRKMEREKGLV